MEIRPPERKIIDIKHPHLERRETSPSQQPTAEVFGYEWEAWEYEHTHKTKNWFISAAIIASGLLIFAIVTNSLLFAVFVLLASFVVYIYALRPPRIIRLAIMEDGIQTGRRKIHFDELKSFWIFYEAGGIKELSLEPKRAVMPHLKVPLGGADPVKIRRALVAYLPEVRQELSMADILARILGF